MKAVSRSLAKRAEDFAEERMVEWCAAHPERDAQGITFHPRSTYDPFRGAMVVWLLAERTTGTESEWFLVECWDVEPRKQPVTRRCEVRLPSSWTVPNSEQEEGMTCP